MLLIVENDLGFAKFLLDAARAKGFKGLVTSMGAGALTFANQYPLSAITLAADLRSNMAAFSCWAGPPTAGDSGTSKLGLLKIASSVRVDAPERHNTRSAACNACGISAFRYATSR